MSNSFNSRLLKPENGTHFTGVLRAIVATKCAIAGHGVTFKVHYFDLPVSTCKPLFSFGFGLSYAQCRTNDFNLTRFEAGGMVLSVSVENISNQNAKEVIQVYLSESWSTRARAVLQLVAFVKVSIPANSRIQTSLPIDFAHLRTEIAKGLQRNASREEHDRLVLKVGCSADAKLLLTKSLSKLIDSQED